MRKNEGRPKKVSGSGTLRRRLKCFMLTAGYVKGINDGRGGWRGMKIRRREIGDLIQLFDGGVFCESAILRCKLLMYIGSSSVVLVLVLV